MIRYLKTEERQDIRKLYEDTFQDCKAFVDYYLQDYVMKDTRCLVWEQAQEIQGMISIHEKQWMIRQEDGTYQIRPVWYLYGVATAKEYRNQGIMGLLLKRIVTDAVLENIPYVYLIPVDEKIYEKHGFRLVRDRESLDSDLWNMYSCVRELGVQDVSKLSAFDIARNEQSQVSAFLYRNENYFREFMKQISLDNGKLYGAFSEGKLIDYAMGYYKDGAFQLTNAQDYPVMIYDNEPGKKIKTLGSMDEV